MSRDEHGTKPGSIEPPGARLIDSDERNGGSTLGKPVYPQYRRMFEIPRGDPERQIQHAAAAAAAAGWTLTADTPARSPIGGALVLLADKELAGGSGDLAITLFPTGPPSAETQKPAMLIKLILHD